MGLEVQKESYTGSIKEVTLGKGDGAVTVGGENCLPFHQFEGEIPVKPKIAMEIWDMEPKEWADAAKEPFKDVLNDPAAWAKKCQDEYGADMICIEMKSTDPNGLDASAEEASKTVQNVLKAINVPLIVWGTANTDKDTEIIRKICEDCENENLVIGPVEDAGHKPQGAAIMGYGHTAISSSPIDINLAKQVNILLENLGLPLDRMIVDPTTGAIGYGAEYCFSIMERIRLAAQTFGDDKLQLPIINNLSIESWRAKESNQPVEENQLLGDPERRGILMEAVGAVTFLTAGSDVIVLRHPENVRMIRAYIDLMFDGGSAKELEGIKKLLSDVDIDYASLSPEMNLSIEEEKKAAPKKEAPPKEEKKAEAKPEAPKAEAKPEPAKEEAKPEAPKAEAKPEPAKEEAKPEPAKAAAAPGAAPAGPAMGAEELKKIIRETVQEVVGSLKAEEKEEKKKEKEPAEKKAKKEKEEKGMVSEEQEKKWAEERAEREKEEERIRRQRRKEREEHMAKKAAEAPEPERKMTPAAEQKDPLDKLLDRIQHFNRVKW